ncbi:hypothetical protein SRHO_G00188480 [Serrasalmus rhombeus]
MRWAEPARTQRIPSASPAPSETVELENQRVEVLENFSGCGGFGCVTSSAAHPGFISISMKARPSVDISISVTTTVPQPSPPRSISSSVRP